jgi:sterol desaturase/sphingolipid hydroxylase (fatty acid hydroxylase superfamily)
MLRRLASILALPGMLAAALAAALLAFERGVPASQVLLPIFFGSAALVALLERVLPYRPEWNRARGDLWTDAAYMPTAWVVNGLLQPLVTFAAVAFASWLTRALHTGLWPHGWPLLGQLALACVVVELPSYWAHRWMHEVPWLWRLHAVHHSAPRLYWLNATRAHPLEMLFRGILGMLPLAIAGASPELIALSGITNLVVGLFQHANVDIALGPLNWVFSAAPVHRWHHSRDVREANRNYGDTFIFWDAAFGTRYLPAHAPPADVGIDGLDAFPRSFPAQILAPFRWQKIQRASAILGPAPGQRVA